MIRYAATLVAGLVIGTTGTFFVQKHSVATPYAGQQTREISSLSADDIAALKAGEGWGLAKPAELNGYPGPAHILELAQQLNLSDAQLSAVRASYATMNAAAKTLGADLIAAEAAVDAAFRSNTTQIDLRAALARTEAARARLRETHLSAHLDVTPLLTDEQRQRYADLRGYGGGHKGH